MTRSATVLRRLKTIPVVFVLFGSSTILLPVLVPLALIIDLGRWLFHRTPFMGTRLLAFGWIYAFAEVVGLIALGGAWLVAGRPGSPARSTRLMRWTYAVQAAWAGTLLGAARTLFGLDFAVEGSDVVMAGPFLLLMRHVSVVDNLLPAGFVANPNRLRLRYALKQELLSDPCLDVAGLRLPNYFVDRSGADTAQAVAGVAALAEGLGPHDAVLVFPEGTRATPEKRSRILARLREASPELAARAARLTHVLPPRLGGTLALLDAGHDVVIAAHRGLDGFAHLHDIWSGAMVRARVDIRFRRFTAAELPPGRSDRIGWLYDRWQEVNDWIDERMARSPST